MCQVYAYFVGTYMWRPFLVAYYHISVTELRKVAPVLVHIDLLWLNAVELLRPYK